MIFNIKNKHPASCLELIPLFFLFFLAACSADEETGPASADSHPAQPKEAPISVERSSESAEEAAASIERRPEYTEEATAAIERHPEYARLSSSSARDYSESASRAPASADSSPLIDDTNRTDEYTVVLGVDETIKIPGLPGELRVWIGSPEYTPDFPERMTHDEASVPAVGESATVQPFAPAFTIEPAQTQCIRIHPSGSEVRFKLIPQKQGSFEVGANVYLFDSMDCSGSPIPKTAATLKVLVEVDSKEAFLVKVNELWDVLWEKFVEFWGALLAIFFGLILFLIRGKLKRWFGYEDN
jgi:hypothetical protein